MLGERRDRRPTSATGSRPGRSAARWSSSTPRSSGCRTGPRRPARSWPARATIDATGTMDEAQAAFERCDAGEPAVAFGEIYIQTGYDPSPAPEGKHLMSVFGQYAPYEIADGDWDARRDGVARAVHRPDLALRARPRATASPTTRCSARPTSSRGSGSPAATSSRARSPPTRCGRGGFAVAHAGRRPLHVRRRHPPGRQRDRAQRPQRRRRRARRRRRRGRLAAASSRIRLAVDRVRRSQSDPRADPRGRLRPDRRGGHRRRADRPGGDARRRLDRRSSTTTSRPARSCSSRRSSTPSSRPATSASPPRPAASESATAALAPAIDECLPVPGRAGARVGAVGRALAARGARAGAAPGRGAALRALPRVDGGADRGRRRAAASSAADVDVERLADLAMALLDGLGVRALLERPGDGRRARRGAWSPSGSRPSSGSTPRPLRRERRRGLI